MKLIYFVNISRQSFEAKTYFSAISNAICKLVYSSMTVIGSMSPYLAVSTRMHTGCQQGGKNVDALPNEFSHL